MRNGEPLLSTINFGTYYCIMYRWAEEEPWTFLATKGKGRRIFPSATEAVQEARRILCPKRKEKLVEEPADPMGREEWKKQRDASLFAERHKVFGQDTHRPKIIFQNGKVIPVETKRRARA